MNARLAAVFLALTLDACATSQVIDEPGRPREYLISCWYFGWQECYDKAISICPSKIYKVVSKDDHGQGRSMRIACENRK